MSDEKFSKTWETTEQERADAYQLLWINDEQFWREYTRITARRSTGIGEL